MQKKQKKGRMGGNVFIRSTFDQMVYEIRFENVYRRVFFASILHFQWCAHTSVSVSVSVCVLCFGFVYIRIVCHHLFCFLYKLCIPDSDEMGQMDSNHYDYNARQTQRNGNQQQQQQKSINTLNLINSVLLRKTALNKLSR